MTVLTAGRVSAERAVPSSIDRPEYVGQIAPLPYKGPAVRDAETIAAMRIAGRIAAQALDAVEAAIAPGVTTDELDRVGHEFIVAQGAYPSTLGYRGYPKSLCSSVNEVICHGIPDDRPLGGDLQRAGRLLGGVVRTETVGRTAAVLALDRVVLRAVVVLAFAHVLILPQISLWRPD